jgi:hypothetical protein
MNRPFDMVIVILTILGCAAGRTIAAEGEGQTGILHGVGHVYALAAPDGWILDNKSGVSQGLHAVFYPKSSSWENGTAVIYTRVTRKDDLIQDAATHVEFTLREFHKSNSPGTKANFLQDLTTKVKWTR